jgi:hypothetical protein
MAQPSSLNAASSASSTTARVQLDIVVPSGALWRVLSSALLPLYRAISA